MALTMKQSTASLRAAAPSAGRRALVCKATKYDDELIATAVSTGNKHSPGADCPSDLRRCLLTLVVHCMHAVRSGLHVNLLDA